MSLERCESGYGNAFDGEEFENNALLNQFQREAGKNLVNVNSFLHRREFFTHRGSCGCLIDIEFNTRFLVLFAISYDNKQFTNGLCFLIEVQSHACSSFFSSILSSGRVDFVYPSSASSSSVSSSPDSSLFDSFKTQPSSLLSSSSMALAFRTHCDSSSIFFSTL